MGDGVQSTCRYSCPTGRRRPAGGPRSCSSTASAQTRDSSDFVTGRPTCGPEILAPKGYAVLDFDARAHGESGGLVHPRRPPRGRGHLRELSLAHNEASGIDAQHVGAYGDLVGGGHVWKAARRRLPLAAIVPTATWSDLYRGARSAGPRAKRAPCSASRRTSRAIAWPGRAAARTPTQSSRRNVPGDSRSCLATRSTRAQVAKSAFRRFCCQGRRDFAFESDQATAAYRRLEGPEAPVPRRFRPLALEASPVRSSIHVARSSARGTTVSSKDIPNGMDKEPPVRWLRPLERHDGEFAGLPTPRRLTFALKGTRSTLRLTRRSCGHCKLRNQPGDIRRAGCASRVLDADR